MAKVKYKGKIYRTKRELAEVLGINYDTLNMRMSRGLTLKAAIEFKPKSTVRFKKCDYNSYQHLINELGLGLTVNQLQYRLKRCGGSLAKAVKYKVPETEVEYKGKTYSSLKQLCDQKGLVYSTIKNRINRQGKSIEEAIRMSEEGGSKRGRKPKSVTVIKAVPKRKGRPSKGATQAKAAASTQKKQPSSKNTSRNAVAKRGPGRPRKTA